MKFLFAIVLLCVCLVQIEAIIVNPRIIIPTNETIWYAGCDADIAWDTLQIVPNVTETHGPIMLGFIVPLSINEHLFFTLVPDTDLTTGSAHITVPNVPTRNDYIVVVFGDSGNASPLFTIRNGGNKCCKNKGPKIPLPPV